MLTGSFFPPATPLPATGSVPSPYPDLPAPSSTPEALVVSYWDVSDDATAKLMSNLFEISKDKPDLSHGEMMRQATLSLLEGATESTAHPRVWAPFVVVGEPARRHSESVRGRRAEPSNVSAADQ
jgi:hypothetical protein